MKMILKFIGENGSLGLTKGRVYSVEVYVGEEYVWVDWGERKCPYSSPDTMWENWEAII